MSQKLDLLFEELAFRWFEFQIDVLKALKDILDPFQVCGDVFAEDDDVIKV